MSLVSSPFGFLNRYHQSGQSRAREYTIAAGQAGVMGYGDPVALDTNGQVIPATATTDILGIFAGVSFKDVTGKPNFRKNWSGAQSGATEIKAYVHDDERNVYEVQVGAGGTTYVQAVIGAQADVVITTPNATTGQSTCALNATPETAGQQGQFRVIGFGNAGPYDATLNPFPEVLVMIAQHQFIASKVGI